MVLRTTLGEPDGFCFGCDPHPLAPSYHLGHSTIKDPFLRPKFQLYLPPRIEFIVDGLAVFPGTGRNVETTPAASALTPHPDLNNHLER